MSQMAIMYHMYPMHCMHVLYPHMRYMNAGIYKREGKKGNRVGKIKKLSKLCTNQKINKEKICYSFDVSYLLNLKQKGSIQIRISFQSILNTLSLKLLQTLNPSSRGPPRFRLTHIVTDFTRQRINKMKYDKQQSRQKNSKKMYRYVHVCNMPVTCKKPWAKEKWFCL